MGNETKSLLFDVIAGCKHIEEFTVSISFDDYEKSSLIRSAVERQFMIVGEAINKLKVVDADIYIWGFLMRHKLSALETFSSTVTTRFQTNWFGRSYEIT